MAISYSKLGKINETSANFSGAFAFYRKYNLLTKELYATEPNNTDFKNGLAISYEKLGNSCLLMGEHSKAFSFYEQHNSLMRELYATYQSNVDFKDGLAISYAKLGEINMTLGHFEQALYFYEQYSRLEQELFEAFPNNIRFKNGLAISYSNLGSIYSVLNNFEKALYSYEVSSNLSKELYIDYPLNVSFKNGIAYSLYNLGNINELTGNYSKAKTIYSSSIELFQEIQTDFPQHTHNMQSILQLHQRLADINLKLGEKDEALKNIGTANSIIISGNNNVFIQDIKKSSITIEKNVVTGSIITAGKFNIGDSIRGVGNKTKITVQGDFRQGDIIQADKIDDKYIEELNTEYLHQAKMIFIGNGDVGKSSIVFRLFDKTNDLPPRVATIGLEVNKNDEHYVIAQLSPEVTKLSGNINYSLSLWDFGGQGKYREVQNLFLSRKTIYVYVTSVDDKPNDEYVGYEYWLQMTKLFGYDKKDQTESPIIHVVNKIDKPEYHEGLDFTPNERKKRFSNINKFVEISCKDLNNNNFQAFENAIRETLPKIGQNENDVFGVRFRKNWFRVKDTLEIMLKEQIHYISYTEYLQICKKNDLDEKEAQEWITYLDRIGTVIYFSDNLILRDWVIINPMWVKDAFCRVIECEELTTENQGKLTKSFRKLVWANYELGDHDKFLSLMLENSFCYLQGEDYVVPACLPDNILDLPDFLKEFDFYIKFQYEHFLPAGIVNRLMVKLHKGIYSSGQEFKWKNGFILHHPVSNSYAIINENWKNKAIEVKIKSTNPKSIYDLIKLEIGNLSMELKNNHFLLELNFIVLAEFKSKFQPIENLKEMQEAKNKFGFLFEHTNKDTNNHKEHLLELVSTCAGGQAITEFLDATKNSILKEQSNPLPKNETTEQPKKIILFISSSPEGVAMANANRQLRSIQDSLQKTRKENFYEIKNMSFVQPANLINEIISYKPDIIHFFMHNDKVEGLSFENGNGKEIAIDPPMLKRLFKRVTAKKQLECVVLNGCNTHIHKDVVSEFVPNVVYTTDFIPDVTEPCNNESVVSLFTRIFYEGVFRDDNYFEALNEANDALMFSKMPLQPIVKKKIEELFEIVTR